MKWIAVQGNQGLDPLIQFLNFATSYKGIWIDDSAQACLVKNVSPIIPIQQLMNNGVAHCLKGPNFFSATT